MIDYTTLNSTTKQAIAQIEGGDLMEFMTDGQVIAPVNALLDFLETLKPAQQSATLAIAFGACCAAWEGMVSVSEVETGEIVTYSDRLALFESIVHKSYGHSLAAMKRAGSGSKAN